MFTVVLVPLLLVFTLFQLTNPGNAVPLLKRTLVEIGEVDKVVQRHHDDLTQVARQHPDAEVEVPDFPVAVTLQAGKLAGLGAAELRDVILTRGAEAAYESGLLPPVSLQGREQTGKVSQLWRVVQWADRALGVDGHQWARRVLTILTCITAGVGLLLVLYGGVTRGLLGLGSGFLLGGLGLLLVAVALGSSWMVALVVPDDPGARALWTIVQQALAVPRTIGWVTAALGLLLVLGGILQERFTGPSEPSRR